MGELAAIAQAMEVYEQSFPPAEGPSLVGEDDYGPARLSERDLELLAAMHADKAITISSGDWGRLRRLSQWRMFNHGLVLTRRGEAHLAPLASERKATP